MMLIIQHPSPVAGQVARGTPARRASACLRIEQAGEIAKAAAVDVARQITQRVPVDRAQLPVGGPALEQVEGTVQLVGLRARCSCQWDARPAAEPQAISAIEIGGASP